MTTPRDDIAGLSERLRQIEIAERAAASIMDMRPEDTANFAYVETAKEAATAIDALQARVKELEAERDKWDRRTAYDELKAREFENRATQQRQIDALTIRAEAAESSALRAEQERDEAYERAAKECSDYARWAEQQISEDDPPESSKSQLFATISNTADDCAEKVRDLVRRLAGPEKEGK